jgi:hypothetical protein
MKQTLTNCDFHDAFIACNRESNFSYEGREHLFKWLEQYEEDTGTEIELDVIALCCEYNEEALEDTLDNYNLKSLSELEDNTMVIATWTDENGIETVLYQAY